MGCTPHYTSSSSSFSDQHHHHHCLPSVLRLCTEPRLFAGFAPSGIVEFQTDMSLDRWGWTLCKSFIHLLYTLEEVMHVREINKNRGICAYLGGYTWLFVSTSRYILLILYVIRPLLLFFFVVVCMFCFGFCFSILNKHSLIHYLYCHSCYSSFPWVI